MYLHRRGPAYYYRRPILKEHIGLWLGPTGKPRKEWSISLRTKDRRTAIDRMAKAEARYIAELARNMAEASKRTEQRWATGPSPTIHSEIRVKLNELPEQPYPTELWQAKVEQVWDFVLTRYA